LEPRLFTLVSILQPCFAVFLLGFIDVLVGQFLQIKLFVAFFIWFFPFLYLFLVRVSGFAVSPRISQCTLDGVLHSPTYTSALYFFLP
jgi:hypothetical protein